ncbi:MAG: spore coat protein [Deltaproteobacteria bacterium]
MAKDMEWMGILLYEHKLAASMLTSSVIESADPQVRQHFTSLLNQTLDHQKQIFDVMNQKGWYKVAPAPQDELNRIQQSFSMMQQQMQ